VLQRRGERLILVSVPSVDVKEAKPVDPTARERPVVNADEVIVDGDGFDELTSVSFQSKSIPFELIEKGKAIRLKNLKALGVTGVPASPSLNFVFKSRRASMKLDVVSAKVEPIAR